MTKPLLTVLKGAEAQRPPVWLMRQAGRYLPEYREVRSRAGGFLDLCYSPELAAEVTLQPITRFGLDAAIIFSDILVVPHALGQSVHFEEGHGPVLDPIRGRLDLSQLSAEGAGDHLAPVYEAIGRVAEELPSSTALIGFCGAPWTLAAYMIEGGSSRDFLEVKRWAYGDPEGFDQLIGLLVEVCADHLARQIDAGAEVVQIFDSWAGVLSARAFERWCVEPVRAIVERLKASQPAIPVIGFPRGAGLGYEGYGLRTGVTAVSLDTAVPLSWAAEAVDGIVQGNLDPALLVVGGDALRSEVARICEVMGNRPFVFNLGHGVVPQTPPENVALLVACLKQ